jgi:uncharacterized membrane protein
MVTITKSTIWFDEAFSAYITQFSFIDIARYTAADVHPPLYYWVLKIWTDLFGTTELAFRTLSMMFGVITIVIGFLLTRRLFGRRAAWVAVLFLALSPMLIRYGQEARMYTMATAIAFAATYTLVRATQSKRRLPWVVYGILVGLGMWTHYFTALVWIAHWVWRFVTIRGTGVRGKKLRQSFFTKNWIIAHIVAVGSFLPWLPFMAIQLTIIQASGFWIGSVGVDTFTSYLTNVLFYREHSQALGWYAVALIVIVVCLVVFGVRAYATMTKQQRIHYLLILSITAVPVILLFIASLPPLKSSFVERYLVPAAAMFAVFAAVTLTVGTKKLSAWWRVIIVGVVAVAMMLGIASVYYFGNYNKNTNTKVTTGEIIREIQARGSVGEPIIAESPWIFYEAIFYSTPEHPVYFIDAQTDYIYGSLKMLQDNDQHKIKDFTSFMSTHPVAWYIGSTNNDRLSLPGGDFETIQYFSVDNVIDGKDLYKAVQFRVR